MKNPIIGLGATIENCFCNNYNKVRTVFDTLNNSRIKVSVFLRIQYPEKCCTRRIEIDILVQLLVFHHLCDN